MNRICRREFLGALTAAYAGAFTLKAGEKPQLKIGVLSDTHISVRSTSKAFLYDAFKYFAAEAVDVVVIAGDVCHDGNLDELAIVVDNWKRAFPDGMNAAGGKVYPFFIFGNHDYHEASYQRDKEISEAQKGNILLYNKQKAWEMITGEKDFSGEVFMREIKGFKFIGAHWGAQGQRLVEFLEQNSSQIPKDRPFFYVQHSHPRGTCYMGRSGGDAGINHSTLMKFPNLFAFSGHSHTSFSYDDAIWQGGFCSMGVSSLRSQRGRRNLYNSPLSKRAVAEGKFTYMRPTVMGMATHAAIVTVYPSRTVVTRHDISNNAELIGEEWSLPFPYQHDLENPCLIAHKALPPEFEHGSTVAATVKKVKTYPSKKAVRALRIDFPAAKGTSSHSRVVDYRVEVFGDDGKRVAERLVAQEYVAQAEKHTLQHSGWCAFGLEELPSGKDLTVRVTPMNAGGKSGKSIEGKCRID